MQATQKVILNGLDYEPDLEYRMNNNRQKMRSNFGIKEDERIVLLAATFKPVKKILTMVKAFEHLLIIDAEITKRTKLFLVGDTTNKGSCNKKNTLSGEE